MNQRLHDRISLALVKRIASELPAHPEWIEIARSSLMRWRRMNADAPALVRCHDEWLSLLERPIDDLCRVLTSTTEDSQRPRQNSPSAGVLSPRTVWEIKRAIRNDEIAA